MRIKQFLNKAEASASDFISDTRGNFAIVFGLALIPMMLAAGVAVDTLRMTHQKAELKAALDAGALAAASSRDISKAKRVQLAKDVFFSNLPKGMKKLIQGQPNFVIGDDKVAADAKSIMPTTLMNLVGINKMEIDGLAEVSFGATKKAELAMVLDSSGSMGEYINGKPKYVLMQEQANKLISDLTATAEDRKRVKMGLVPFSGRVLVKLPGTMVEGGSNEPVCISDRVVSISDKKFGEDITTKFKPETSWKDPGGGKQSCKTYKDNGLEVIPLTSDFDKLRSTINRVRPTEYTHISLGAEMAYHLLAPKAVFNDGAEFDDKNTKKFLVILTDGKQTETANGVNGGKSVSNAESNLGKICHQAKGNNITVITIAFDLDDSFTRKNLQSCATAGNSHVVEDTDELADAFGSIKNQLVSQIYLSK